MILERQTTMGPLTFWIIAMIASKCKQGLMWFDCYPVKPQREKLNHIDTLGHIGDCHPNYVSMCFQYCRAKSPAGLPPASGRTKRRRGRPIQRPPCPSANGPPESVDAERQDDASNYEQRQRLRPEVDEAVALQENSPDDGHEVPDRYEVG